MINNKMIKSTKLSCTDPPLQSLKRIIKFLKKNFSQNIFIKEPWKSLIKKCFKNTNLFKEN